MRILTIIILLLAGNGALLFTLKGDDYAIQRLYRDTTGDAFEAPPDASWRARGIGYDLDYNVGVRLPTPSARGLPERRTLDPLDDMRMLATWVRVHLAVGDFYRERVWSLDEILTAANAGHEFFCSTYAHALVTVAQTCGYPARVIGLNGHITSEIYDRTRSRWVMVESLYDCIPFGRDGEPLSLLQTSRILAAGDSVTWQAITGIPGDDDEMYPKNRPNVENIIRRGDFTIADGRATFGRIPLRERVIDLLTGRTRTIQLALHGEPAKDRLPRRLRLAILAWNLLGVFLLGWTLVRGRRLGGAPA